LGLPTQLIGWLTDFTHIFSYDNIKQLKDENCYRLINTYLKNPVSYTLSHVLSELPEQFIVEYIDELIELISKNDLVPKINTLKILNKVSHKLHRGHLRQVKSLLEDQSLYIRDCAYDFLKEIYFLRGVSI
jgi:hypothetical protein